MTVTDETFDEEVLAQAGTVLVDFGAKWCPPCRALEPLLESLAEERKGSVKIVKVDTDESPEVTRRWSVRSVPTLVVFRDGQKHAQVVGAVPKEKLRALVER